MFDAAFTPRRRAVLVSMAGVPVLLTACAKTTEDGDGSGGSGSGDGGGAAAPSPSAPPTRSPPWTRPPPTTTAPRPCGRSATPTC
ncbi:hypothetical protein FM106_22300 [Brachybacterium faecium]|nr:hypothetical protein FM106_22300 [Brachybacterium faecium]